jgi:hypothetical protein
MHFIIITAVRHDDSCLLCLTSSQYLSIMNIAVSLFNPIITALTACASHNSTAMNEVRISLADKHDDFCFWNSQQSFMSAKFSKSDVCKFNVITTLTYYSDERSYFWWVKGHVFVFFQGMKSRAKSKELLLAAHQHNTQTHYQGSELISV